MFLNCHSYFSFRYGIMSPTQLLDEAAKRNIRYFALTDINNTSGVLEFSRLAKEYSIAPVVGIDFRNGNEQNFIGLAKNADGFYELNKFLSYHLHSGEKIPPHAPVSENVFIVYPVHNAPATLHENEFIGIEPNYFNKLKFSEWRKHPDKLVSLLPVIFRTQLDFNCHRLLRSIDKNTILSKLSIADQAKESDQFLARREVEEIYSEFPQLIKNSEKILEQCSIDFEFGANKNKLFFTGSAKGDREKLLQLCKEGLEYRYPKADNKIAERLNKELEMIHEKEFASYFLINHDIISFAQRENYFYVGRGSGANSIVAYLLRITDVDPIDLDLYFERFINPSRINPPDFDIDFSSNERDYVIDYIFNQSSYGKDHVALLATYSTFQDSALVRELGKVYGLPKLEIDSLAFNYERGIASDVTTKQIFRYTKRLLNFPNHLSIHAGGILISEKPIYYYTATNLPPKNFPTTQFSMLEAEDVGLYKFDILSQRGLGKIKDSVDIIKKNKGDKVDVHDINRFKSDEKIRENLKTANLIGCFYVESPAMRMLLTKLKASTYLDLVAASSIIRPGVAQSGMMREYILRFHDPRRRDYIHPMMKELMEETFGVMVYQEDVIKVAHHFAKLTLSEADMLRRGMSGKYRARSEFQKVEQKFFDNCKAVGYPDSVTKEVWRQIESFAGYAFSKGHSASYAVESYQCMFLKTYYPLEYLVACLNNGGGFYSKEVYVHEIRQCGGTIHAPHINKSDSAAVIFNKDVYLGLDMIKELEKDTVEKILTERFANGEFSSLTNFMNRVEISVEQLRLLIRINAFRPDNDQDTGKTKKQLLWDIYSVIGSEKKTEVRRELFEVNSPEFKLPELHEGKSDDAFDEIELLGFPLCSPFELLKNELPSQLIAADLPRHLGNIVSIVGYLVTTKSARTKKGDTMGFGTFLDKQGKWIDTTHFPQVLKNFPFTRRQSCYLITGKVMEEFGFYSMDVTEMKLLENVIRT